MKKLFLSLLVGSFVLFAAWAALPMMHEDQYPIDVTEKIVNPSFSDGLTGWTTVTAGIAKTTASGGNTALSGNNVPFEFNQTISGLEPGRYTLKFQAFGRMKSDVDSYADYLAGKELGSNVFIYANNAEKEAMNVVYGAVSKKGSGTWTAVTGASGETLYLLDNSAAVAEAFALGFYEDELTDIIVGQDGKLLIGIKKTSDRGSDSHYNYYGGADNFRLYYEGPVTEASDAMISALKAKMPKGDMNSDVKSAMEAAVSTLDTDKAYEKYEVASAAVQAAIASAEAYAKIAEALAKVAATDLSAEAKAGFDAKVGADVAAYEAKTLKAEGTAVADAILQALDEAVKADLANSSDKTALLKNPQFADGVTGWSGDFGNGKQKGLASNKLVTSYGGGFDVYQTLEGMEPGIYLVKAQAFSRPVSNDDTWKAFYAGEALVNETYIYANGSEKKVKFIVEDYLTASQSGGTWSTYTTADGGKAYIPNNSDAFSIAFSAGLYENEMYCVVGEDGKLTLGIRNDDKDNSVSYAGYDNFRLYYIGSCDMTAKIANPEFEEGDTGWTWVEKGIAKVTKQGNNTSVTGNNDPFELCQTLTDMIPGTYSLKVQAFGRMKSNADSWTDYLAGKSLTSSAYIYGNETEKEVTNVVYGPVSTKGSGDYSTHTTADGKTVYLLNNSKSAAEVFANRDLYENEVLVTVREDGVLKIGFKKTSSSTDWNLYAGCDNFRLTYVSTEIRENEEAPETVEDMIAALEAMKTVSAQADATAKAAFNEVYTASLAVLKDAASTEDAIATAKANAAEAFATLLKNGTTTSGQFDLTSLIKNADFASDAQGWKQSKKSFKWNNIGVLQVSNVQSGDQLMQTLKSMPAGKYTLKVQGFYQAQGWKQSLFDREHGKEVNKLSLVFNETTTPIKSIFDDTRCMLASDCVSRVEDVGAKVDGSGFPLLIGKVSSALTLGGYWTVLEAEVAEDGDITLGVNLDETELADNWAILDNFRLYYGEHNTVELKSGITYNMADDTPADVHMTVNLMPGKMNPFSAPCDIDASQFKGVYEIGALDYDTKTAYVYPVEKVRAGVPCYIEVADTLTGFDVKHALLKAAKEDTTPLAWDGGLIYAYYKTYNWRTKDLAGAVKGGVYFTNVVKQDLNDMDITGNVTNYQVRMFLSKTYTQSSSSVVATYNAVAPARRDLPHAIGVPVPASKAKGAVISYSLNSDMYDAKSINNINEETVCHIPNLIPDNTYYYTVTSAAGEVVSKGKINVEGPLRMVYAPSIYNVRDLGGWTVDDGRKTRYGLIYRGGEVNGYHCPAYDDVLSMVDLGIGAEVDLRWNDSWDQDRETGKSGYNFVLGDTYYFAGANDYQASDMRNADTWKRFNEEFHFIMKHIRKGTGVHFHCVFGADRTGLLALLLEGVLGLDLNQLYHDYEFTSFAAPAGNRNKSAIQERIAVVQEEAGATLKEKFESYWIKKCGLTMDEIEEFRSIMLVDPTATPIDRVQLSEKDAATVTVKAVYTTGGAKVPASALNSKSGVYVVKYSDGTSKKVVVKK